MTVAERRRCAAYGSPTAANARFIITLSIADRGADHARADVREVGQLEQALHGAVLAVGTVEQREHDVDVERARRAGGATLAVDRRTRRRQRGSGTAALDRRARAESASSHRPSVVIATGTTS